MGESKRARCALGAIILGGILLGNSARAQDEPPQDAASPTGTAAPAATTSEVGDGTAPLTSDSRSPRPGYFSLTQLRTYLEFEGQFDQVRVRSDLGRQGLLPRTWSQTNRDSNFEERFGLRLGGSIIDPSVITYQADLSFGLTQSHFQERAPYWEQTDDDSGTLLLYDLRFNFFTGRPLSGSLYAFRRDDRINRRFLPSLNDRQTGFGTNWTYVRNNVSMQLNYDHLETDRTGNADRRDDEYFLDRTLSYSLDWNLTERHTVTFSYEHAETKQEYQGLRKPFETTRDLFIIDDRLRFGPEDRHELWTRVRWQEESGDFARDIFEFGPQLTLKHSDNLRTIYRYQFNRDRYENYDIGLHRADWQLIHQLYTNLTTSVNLFGLYEDIENDVKTNQYGAVVDWQYNRKNRYGHFYANLALSYDTENVSGNNGVRLVLNEAHVMRDPVPVTLRNRYARPLSIVVTDAANRRVYFLGRDYVIQRFGNVTQLYRVPAGRIPDGDTVLVDYEYESPADGQLDTVRTDFSVEQRFTNGLTPYYRFSYRNQEDDESLGFARYADRTDHHRIGITYQKDRWTVGGEYEIFDDTILPYDAFHLNGAYRVIQQGRHTLDVTARFSRFFYSGEFDNRNVSWLDLAIDHRWQLRRDLASFERFNYRWQDDSVRGVTNGWDVTAGFDYVIGELTAQFVIEYDRLELPGSIEDDLGVYLRLRRDFPDVFARR